MSQGNEIGFLGKFLRAVLRTFFYLLYHPLAWTYDWVADFVSVGRWKEWIFLALPYLKGSPILELGHGPGHLQIALHKIEKRIYGIDSSRQMVRIAKRRITNAGFSPLIVQGTAECLPYSSNYFSYITATFPSEYIFDPDSLREVWRVLVDGGELIIIAGAWITGTKLFDSLAAWLFRVTGQAPVESIVEIEKWYSQEIEKIQTINFQIATELIELETSEVLLVQAKKVLPLNRKSFPPGVQ